MNTVSLGHRYKFSANLRLHPDMPANEKHNINVKLQCRLATDASFRYLFIATASGVSSEAWVQVKGRVNMPPDIPGNQLIAAILYFGNAPTEVSFMVAKTRLCSLDPTPSIAEKLSIKNLNLSRECSDLTTGAPVFISYQWDIQDKVKKLRDKLEKCGISCWMDIGQMGGGDSLYSEIDKGMRTAKVIISCVTRKYTTSENCQREATLADCLKKPIIPVIFDNELQWPPPGQMSMIFAKLLYINVCSDDKDEIPPMKFQELLSEIKERIEI
ncbi:uncharacterized protein LOC116302217 [Actinia tenebrosa]|uniref:Uncharacterized protein LOC116302217 n=1 Tax=Actinia tenebrosa TaxID=6105 RepID=A0A6P8IKW8_ACTTE|nr:uncharacterized protein LOC116302217 [Actinia tenebrosa]